VTSQEMAELTSPLC